jgi:phage tail protein X
MKHLLHRTKAGERWDTLSYRYYRTVERQGTLIAANRALFAADLAIPMILPGGVVLKIPVIEPATSEKLKELLPPWKQ